VHPPRESREKISKIITVAQWNLYSSSLFLSLSLQIKITIHLLCFDFDMQQPVTFSISYTALKCSTKHCNAAIIFIFFVPAFWWFMCGFMKAEGLMPYPQKYTDLALGFWVVTHWLCKSL
jgi:hypothetical protein